MDKKSANSTGYRLHKDRILFSGGEIIRTIKYPLVPFQETEENKKFLKRFEETVIADDLRIRGDLNLNDYLNYTAKGNIPYTLFDFWVDSLRVGVIWMSKTADLIDFVSTKYNLTSPLDIMWEKASPRITDYFEKDKFKDILLSDPVRNSSTEKSFRVRLIQYLKENHLVKNGSEYEVVSPQAKKEIDMIASSFFDPSGNLILNGEKQCEFWKREYGLDKSVLESAKPQGDYKDITFIIIPELITDSDNQKLEDLIAYREKWLGDDKLLPSILGLTNNFNGFSNFLGVVIKGLQKENEQEKIFEAQKTILPSLEDNKEKVLHALSFLSEKANLLGKASLPLVVGWHEYRSVFGGKIQSWFSNFIERQAVLDEKTVQFKSDLQEVKNYLSSLTLEEAREDINDLQELIGKLLSIENEDIKKEKIFEIFDSLLSSLRKRLNFFYQQYLYNEAKEGDNVKKHKILGLIFKNIEKPIAFYGEAQRKKNEKFVNDTIPILEEGTIFLTTLIPNLLDSFSPKQVFPDVKKKDETEEIVYRKELQFFWNKLKDLAVNSKEFEKEYQNVIESVVDESELSKLKELFVNKKKNGSKYTKYTFYKSKYAKGSVEEIKLKDSKEEYLLRFEKLIRSLTNFLMQFDRNKLLQDKDLLLDWVELAKNIISVLIRFSTNIEFSLNEIKTLNRFKKAKNYLELFRLEKAKKKEFGFIIQSFILSEIKGAATLYSKQKYIASYSVQIVGSNNKFKLFYQPLDSSINISGEPKDFVTKKHKYLIVFQDLEKVKNKDATENRVNLLRLDKERKIPFVARKDDLVSKSFLLSSSYYQLQFLDKYLYRPRGWENIDIKLNEWSFIVEEAYDIEWDLNSKTPKLIPNPKSNRNKLYLAIPFTLKFTKDKDNVKEPLLDKIVLKSEKENDHSRDKNRLNYPILGVDVGEYGVAWCLSKFGYNQDFSLRDIDIQGKGFIEDRNIGKIKDYFAEIQQKSRKGAYDEDDTTIAKVRENAIGKLRNAIHSILTGSLEGASPVYEDAISNFETGSGKTTKIYNSVKRADTEFKSEADKAEHSLVWGKKDRDQETKYIGRNVSAYASSYTCVNCLHTLYKIKKEDLSKIKILEKDGRIVTMSSPYGPDKKVRGYLSEKEKYEIGYQFKESEKDLEAFRKIVRDFARPPVNKNSEVLEKYAKEILAGNKIEKFKEKRGNSSVFVCPFCQFVADADVQAAFMMAMRGYLRFSGIVPSKENSKNKSQESEKSEDKSLKNSKNQPETGDTFLIKTAEYLQQLQSEIKEKIKEAVKIDFSH